MIYGPKEDGYLLDLVAERNQLAGHVVSGHAGSTFLPVSIPIE